MTLGTVHFAKLPPETAYRVLDAFAEAGGSAVDTASFYGRGYVESVLGSWLRRAGPVVRVRTKLGYFEKPGDHREHAAVREAFERSVARLGGLPGEVLLHEADWACWWDPRSSPGELGAPPPGRPVPAWETLRELAAETGVGIGVSGNNAGILATAAARLSATGVLVAKQYDLLWRSAEVLLATPGLRVDLGAPFHQGRLFDLAALTKVPGLAAAATRLRTLLHEAGVRVEDVAVPFVLAEHRARGVCVGLSSVSEVAALTAAATRVLDPGLLAALRAAGVRHPPMPGPAGTPEYLAPPWRDGPSVAPSSHPDRREEPRTWSPSRI
ncbi:aldo/keto reductase [Amycolatopsis sp. NPDC058340]|uniref:aldo/keto reductase n=1 Tax=Amycolatopsis sp. NPDC058340 TaxID=3346453 RepID=UPI0036492355